LNVAGILLLRGIGGRRSEQRPLTDNEEQAIAEASRHLVTFTASPARAAIIHRTAGGRDVCWDRDGAFRLARSLPPACAGLSNEIASSLEHRTGEVTRLSPRTPRTQKASRGTPSRTSCEPTVS
jgi:hypothetical protein